MAVLLTLSILLAPIVVAVALAWAVHRSDPLPIRMSAPMRRRLSGDNSDAMRLEHELDAIRTRFEPTSGERR